MAIVGTPLPAASNAYRGIELEPVAEQLNVLPKHTLARSAEKLKVTVSLVGVLTYSLYPHCFRRDTGYEVAYYVAYSLRNDRAEYVVGPSRVRDFEFHGRTLAAAAGLFYGMGRRAHPSAVSIVVAQRHALAGRPWEAIKAQMRAAGEMWSDPVMVVSATAEVGAIGAARRVKPTPGSSIGRPRLTSRGTPRSPIVSPVYRIAGRDVVVVETSLGRQVFYRSSGANSGKPGCWFPIDEIFPTDGWFNKAAYTEGRGLEKGAPLHRLGNAEFARISDRLGRMNIPRGADVPAGVFEGPAVTLNRIMDFFGVRVTKKTLFRPVPE